MQTIIARPETAAQYIGGAAERVSQVAALAEEAVRLLTGVRADPRAPGLRHALAVLGARLGEAAAAVRAQQPNVAMFAAVEQARQDQCASCPLFLRAQMAVVPQRRAPGTVLPVRRLY